MTDRDHLFNGTDLTSCKRKLSEWYGFFDRCMYYTIQNIQRILSDNIELHV